MLLKKIFHNHSEAKENRAPGGATGCWMVQWMTWFHSEVTRLAKPSLGNLPSTMLNMEAPWSCAIHGAVIFITVTSKWVRWRFNSPASRLFIQPKTTDQRKHQSSASLAFVMEIHRWMVNFPHKGPVTRKMFPLDDVIIAHRSNPPGKAALRKTPVHNARYTKLRGVVQYLMLLYFYIWKNGDPFQYELFPS